LPLDARGQIDVEALKTRLDAADKDSPMLIAVHAVNNETGIVQPLMEIQALIGPTPNVLLVDAVQAYGKRDLDFATSAIDMMAVSAHKIGGPAGVGALFVKSHCDTVRLVPGGGQEQGRRGGTESAALIAGFGAAAAAFPDAYRNARAGELIAALEYGVHKRAPDAVVFGGRAERIGSISAFAVPGLRASVAMMRLDLAGVAISSGSACSSGKVGKSHVLDAMGVDHDLAECALRVSFGWPSTAADVESFLVAFDKLVARRSAENGQAA
jgi:cysteine desulfurase